MRIPRNELCLRSLIKARWWWCTPLIPALGKQRQVDLCVFEASLVYRVSSRTARAAQRNPVLKTKQNKKQQKVEVYSIIQKWIMKDQS